MTFLSLETLLLPTNGRKASRKVQTILQTWAISKVVHLSKFPFFLQLLTTWMMLNLIKVLSFECEEIEFLYTCQVDR